MKTKEVNKILETKDYQAFRFTEDNRGVDEKQVKKLVRSMKRVGWVDFYPMGVAKSNTGYEVMDGQHRFQAAKFLGIPVKFTVCDCELEIAEMNRTQKTWSATDYAKSYANKGVADYRALLEFCEIHKTPIFVAVALLSQKVPCPRLFRDGGFRVVDGGWASMRIAEFERMRPYMLFNPFKINFVRAWVRCCRVPGFNPDQFIRNIKANPSNCKDMATDSLFIEAIEATHNYRSRNPVSISFAAKQEGNKL